MRKFMVSFVCAFASLALVVMPLQAAPDGKKAVKAPKAFKGWKAPIKGERLKKVEKYVEAQKKKGKLKKLKFKKGASAKQRNRTVKKLDKTLKKLKTAKGTPAEVKDAIKIWESMNKAQKKQMLANPDSVVAAVPGVALAVAAAGLTIGLYNAYKGQQRENERDGEKGGDDDEPADDEPAEVLDALNY